MPVNPPTYAQDPGGPDGGATGQSNLTSHLNDPAMRRAPPGKTAGAPDDAADEGTHSDLSPLAQAAATPQDEARRLALEAAAADVRARRNTHAERPEVTLARAAEKARQEGRPM